MTFSLISVAIILITALVIIIEVLRAIRRGMKKTLVTLASIFLAIFSSMVITNFLSKPITSLIMDPAMEMANIDFSSIKKTFGSIEDIAFSYMDAIIAPIVFLIVFVIMRILIAIIMKIVNRVMYKKNSEIPYQQEDAPQYKKKPMIVNGLLGALCGFMLMMVFISPIMGSLKLVTNTVKKNDEKRALNIPVSPVIVGYLDACSKDIAGNVIYYCGGNLVYKAAATSTLNENHFALEEEVDESFNNYKDIISVGAILNDLNAATPEMKNSAHNFGNNINKAETLKMLSYDVFPKLAKSWLDDKPYSIMGGTWSRPKVNGACESFFNKMLNVCRQSTPDTVGEDFTTLINVYIIAHEKGILFTQNYKEMVEKANDTGAFQLIREELNKNPRMAGISFDIDTMSVKSLASALQSYNLENYNGLMNNITNMLNYSTKYSDESRLLFIKNNLNAFVHNYGVRVGSDVVDSVSNKLCDDVIGNKSAVTLEEVMSFWDKYSQKSNIEDGSVQQQIPPVTVPSENTGENGNENGENQSGENEMVEIETDENEMGENETGENETGENENNGEDFGNDTTIW